MCFLGIWHARITLIEKSVPLTRDKQTTNPLWKGGFLLEFNLYKKWFSTSYDWITEFFKARSTLTIFNFNCCMKIFLPSNSFNLYIQIKYKCKSFLNNFMIYTNTNKTIREFRMLFAEIKKSTKWELFKFSLCLFLWLTFIAIFLISLYWAFGKYILGIWIQHN